MRTSREPMLLPVQLDALRPTQMTVGLREVKRKREEWREQRDDAGKYLGRHMIPVVLGPKGKSYVIDHHHLARALIEEGQEEVLTTVIADLRPLSQDAFWVFLDNRGWLHPFDEQGQRRGYDDIPKRIRDLADDPFRSLAGAVRQAGGYAKETTPFSEFIWADYLRRLIKRTTVEKNFDKALDKALAYARSHDARFMPGWCGADPDKTHHG